MKRNKFILICLALTLVNLIIFIFNFNDININNNNNLKIDSLNVVINDLKKIEIELKTNIDKYTSIIDSLEIELKNDSVLVSLLTEDNKQYINKIQELKQYDTLTVSELSQEIIKHYKNE